MIAISHFLRSIYTAAVSSRLHCLRDHVAGFLRFQEKRAAPGALNCSQEESTTQAVLPPRYIVFSDTDDDLSSVKATLGFAGILDRSSGIHEHSEGIKIFHTGDLIDKKRPDLSVVEYWQSLQKDALRKGCRVKLIAGNHEQEVWRRIRAGQTYGMTQEQTHKLTEFIESMDLFYVTGSVLFIHGYPTLEFLDALAHFKEVTGKDLNRFNEDHYKKSFKSVRAMKQYSYVRDNRKVNHLLYDLKSAGDYYKKKGRLIGALLEQLQIRMVVHGHKPQRSGLQADYEFGKWLPDIRMVGNDTNVSQRGIGATVILTEPTGDLDVIFVNAKTASNELRKEVQKSLGKTFVTVEEQSSVETAC